MTPATIMEQAAYLLNDGANRQIFTDTALIPYLNIALLDLQRIFQLNNIPVTNETSAVLPVAAGVSRIAFESTVPILPVDLIEIRQLWESQSGQDTWTPMRKREYLPHYLQDNQTINQFLIWAWIDQEIHLIAANADNDLKIDYIKTIAPTVTSGNKNVKYPVLLSQDYLQYRTAALAAYFVGENPERASVLNDEADKVIAENLQISVKGKQSISVKRRPFRAAFKMRSYY